MLDKYNKTVDLKEDAQQKARAKKAKLSRAAQIDQVYGGGRDGDSNEMQKINQPAPARVNEPVFKRAVVILAIIAVVVVSYFLFFRKDSAEESIISNWYSVKLVNNEIFYGQIDDTSADPVVIKNVYYIYDQQKDEDKEFKETGNLRLVKRGQETHGPNGTMSVVRGQVLYMEPLKDDSKVLAAILSYER